jgi:hypothetical protein
MRSLGAKCHQTEEYFDIGGCTTSDLADLLANDKHDAPWVLRPAYAKFFFTGQHLHAKPLTPSYPHHSLGCGPNINIRKINFLNKQAQERENIPPIPFLCVQGVMPVHPTTELLLGMAGYIPMRHDHGPRSLDDDILHELWMHETRQHTRIHPRDRTVVTVFYGPAGGILPQNTLSKELLEVTEQTLLVVSHFNNVVSSLQEVGFISDWPPTLCLVANDYVEVMNIKLSHTSVLFDNLKAVVEYLGSCDKPKSLIGDVFKRMTASIELQALSHGCGSSTLLREWEVFVDAMFILLR